MAISLTMPRLGESVTEGTVTRWLKAEGEHVDADEPLLEVSTDKVDTEVPSPVSGTVLSIKVQEDETVEVGVELAVIGDADDHADDHADDADAGAEAGAGEEPVASLVEEPVPAAPVAPPPTAPSAPPAAPVAAGTSRGVAGAFLSPLVRKLAGEHGVDLSTVSGTGVGGRIRKSDVLAMVGQTRTAAQVAPSPTPTPAPVQASAPASAPAAAPATAPAASGRSSRRSSGRAPAAAPAARSVDSPRGRVEKMSRMRQVIATRMVESLQVSAQLTTVVEVDVTRIARLRERAKADFLAREGVKLSFLPFFAVAAIEALKAHPVVNSSVNLQDKTITFHDAEHLGIAVDTDRGLLVPVIHDAGDLNLAGVARKIADLAARTRDNKVAPDELGGGTFTLTNTGSRGALFDTPIINQPQVGILGTGAVVKRAVVIDDDDLGETIAVRSMVYLALSYDHRIVDGADAARFLVTMKQRLETGSFHEDVGPIVSG